MTLATLIVNVEANTAKLVTGVDSVNSKLSTMSSAAASAAGMMGLAFTGTAIIGGIISIGKELMADADALVKLSDKTNISIEGLQAMRVAGDDASVTLEAMTSAVTMLQKRLGGDDQGAAKAMADLGIELEAFKQQDGANQMALLATKVQGIHDPLRVADDLSKLFGKSWAEMLPVLKRGFQEVQDGSAQMSSRTTHAIDDIGDAILRLWRSAKVNLGEAFGDILTGTTSEWRALKSEVDRATTAASKWTSAYGQVIPPSLPKDLDAINASMDIQAKRIIDASTAALAHQKALDAVNLKIADATRDTGHLTAAQDISIQHYKQLGLSNDDIATKMGISALAIKKLEDAHTFASKAVQTLYNTFGTLASIMPDLSGRTAAFRDELDTLASTSNEFSGGMSVAGDVLDHTIIPAFTTLPDVVAGGTAEIKKATDATKLAKDEMRLYGQAINGLASGDIPSMIQGLMALRSTWKDLSSDQKSLAAGSAIEGGLALAASMSNPKTRTGGALSGAAKGAAIGTMIMPGWGTAIGAGVGAIYGALKVPQEEKDARAAFETYQKQFGTLDQMIAAVGKAYSAMGLSGTRAEHDLAAALDATHRTADDVNTALIAINDVLALQAERAAAIGVVNDQLKTLGGTIDAIGIGIPDFLQPMIDDLLAAPGLTDELRASIKGLRDSASPDFAKLESVAKGYGIQIDQLGPKFQQAHVTADAKKWITDFDNLMAAGADFNGVLGGMADEASAVVQESLKFGVDIPANMKPMIQSLIDSGQLFDENKQAITDISQLKFGAAVKTDVDKLKDAIELLADAISKIPGKISDIANTHIPPVHVPAVIDWPAGAPQESGSDGNFAATGGYVTAHGIQHFANGGNVLAFRSRGTDTVPAMLTPGEMVLTKRQQRAVFGGGGDGATAAAIDRLAASQQRRDVFLKEIIVSAVKAAVRQRAA